MPVSYRYSTLRSFAAIRTPLVGYGITAECFCMCVCVCCTGMRTCVLVCAHSCITIFSCSLFAYCLAAHSVLQPVPACTHAWRFAITMCGCVSVCLCGCVGLQGGPRCIWVTLLGAIIPRLNQFTHRGFHFSCLAKLMATSIMTSPQHSVIGLQTLRLSANPIVIW